MTFEEGLKKGNLIVADCAGSKANSIKIISDVIRDIEGKIIILKGGSRTVKNSVKHVYVKNERIENPDYDPKAVDSLR